MTDCADYRAIHLAIARTYVDAFNNVVGDEIGIDLGLKFESMTSPREYNFETDRIFAYVPVDTIEALFAASVADNHAALRKVLEERHTSYSGFHSYYSNDVESWLAKPLADWDHNELCSLLCAAMLRAGMTDWRWDVYYAVVESDGIHHEYEAGFDYVKFQERVTEAREEKRAAIADDSELLAEVSAYESRCPDTLDLFKS